MAIGVLWPPALLGVYLALEQGGRPEAPHCLGLLAVLLLLQCVILFANDLADEAADRANPSPPPWSGGSRVLVEGRLNRTQLWVGLTAAAGGFVTLVTSTPSSAGGWNSGPWPWALGAIAAIAAYNVPPLQLSRRIGGALLQGIGLGYLLPSLVFHTLSPATAEASHWTWMLAPAVLLGTAQGIASAIPDAGADHQAGKMTWAVRVGARVATRDARLLVLLAAVGTLLVPTLGSLPEGALRTAALVPGLVTLLWGFGRSHPPTQGLRLCGGIALVWVGWLTPPLITHLVSW